MPRFDNGIFDNLTNGFESEKVTFSQSAQEHFECVNSGIDVNAKVRFSALNLKSWPENRLRSKARFFQGQQQRYHEGQVRSFPGCIGRRLGVPNLRRSTRERKMNLCPYSISNIIL